MSSPLNHSTEIFHSGPCLLSYVFPLRTEMDVWDADYVVRREDANSGRSTFSFLFSLYLFPFSYPLFLLLLSWRGEAWQNFR